MEVGCQRYMDTVCSQDGKRMARISLTSLKDFTVKVTYLELLLYICCCCSSNWTKNKWNLYLSLVSPSWLVFIEDIFSWLCCNLPRWEGYEHCLICSSVATPDFYHKTVPLFVMSKTCCIRDNEPCMIIRTLRLNFFVLCERLICGWYVRGLLYICLLVLQYQRHIICQVMPWAELTFSSSLVIENAWCIFWMKSFMLLLN